MNLFSNVAAVIAALSLIGCVAVWGDSFNVALANSKSIVIEYDPAVVSVPRMLQTAQKHCDQFERDAVLDTSSEGNLGILVNTYRCEDRT